MPDPYHDRVLSVALELDGVWLDDPRDVPGIFLTSKRDPSEVLRELVDAYQRAGWRIEHPPRYTPVAPEVRNTVLDLTDRQCRVVIRRCHSNGGIGQADNV